MSRFFYGLSFALVALSVLFGGTWYVWARTVRDTRLSRGWKKLLTLALVALGISVPSAFFVSRHTLGEGQFGLVFLGYVWLGALFYAVLSLAALDVLRIVLPRKKRSMFAPRGRADRSRRAFMARAFAGAAIIGSGGVVARGRSLATAGEILTPEVPVKLARLPKALSGYRIAQLSDLHLGPLLGNRFLDAVVEKTNALKADLIVITGDLVDQPVSVLGREITALARLRARHGVVFVTGNHEYYSGADEWIEWVRAQEIRVLMNERVTIGDAGASFDLAGIPDKHAGMFFADHEPDLERALLGRDPERELVLLAHQPAQIEMAQGRGVGLVLSGHTHGGQLWPFGAIVALAQPYIAGLHRHDDATQIYVSRGTGCWGPPMRVGNPAEITSIVLTD